MIVTHVFTKSVTYSFDDKKNVKVNYGYFVSENGKFDRYKLSDEMLDFLVDHTGEYLSCEASELRFDKYGRLCSMPL